MRQTGIGGEENPNILKAAAVLFLVEGLFGAFDTTIAMSRDIEAGILPLHINFLLIGFPICIGLLRNRNTWRVTGVVVSWIQIVITSITFTASIAALSGFSQNLPERLQINLETWLAPGQTGTAVLAAVGLAEAIWKYRVLRKPEIRALFVPTNTSGSHETSLPGEGTQT